MGALEKIIWGKKRMESELAQAVQEQKGVLAVISPVVKAKTKDEAIINSAGKKVRVDMDSVERIGDVARVNFFPENGGKPGFILTPFLITGDEGLIKLGAKSN